jgi:hypothetical protein
MEWQTLFNQLNDREIKTEVTETCEHADIRSNIDYDICADCGVITGRKLCTTTQFVANGMTRRAQNHCTIYNDIPDDFDSTVKHKAVSIYKLVTAKRIFRCKQRKSILAACIHRASVLLDAPKSHCFTTFNLENTDINKGISFVASRLPVGEFNIPVSTAEEDIISECQILQLTCTKYVLAIYLLIKDECEEMISSSQRSSITYGCIWACYKIFKIVDAPETLVDFKAPISGATIEKKYCTIMKFFISRVMKKIYAWCFRKLGYSGTITSETPKNHITIHNCSRSKFISMIANDGFVYPLDDVDDIDDWNILFNMMYLDKNNKTFQIPIHVICKMKKIGVSFEKCNEPIKSKGNVKLDREIQKLVSNVLV